MSNALYYGDNLAVLRESVADESVDLIYLDPPFNSQATYNVLFRGPAGDQSKAQIEAFEDTWHWNESAERAFDEVMTSGNADAAEMLRAMRSFLRENDMMAYLAMDGSKMAIAVSMAERSAARALRLRSSSSSWPAISARLPTKALMTGDVDMAEG